jgi:hypothetical protein
MGALSTTLIVLAGLLNLLPVSGVLSSQRLQSLYGVALQDPNVVILMRHRAILFGVVGCLLIASAFHPPLRPAGYAAGFVSMLSFVLIAWLVGSYNPELRRVVVVDLVASAALLGALLLDHAVGTALRRAGWLSHREASDRVGQRGEGCGSLLARPQAGASLTDIRRLAQIGVFLLGLSQLPRLILDVLGLIAYADFTWEVILISAGRGLFVLSLVLASGTWAAVLDPSGSASSLADFRRDDFLRAAVPVFSVVETPSVVRTVVGAALLFWGSSVFALVRWAQALGDQSGAV